MSALEATVEVLTAEVRTLMVGSRQVTLSVYKQLDEFNLWERCVDDFDPFGRVHSGMKIKELDRRYKPTTVDPFIELVGRDRDGGALVRVTVTASDWGEFSRDVDTRTFLNRCSDLPLIVLAGLR